MSDSWCRLFPLCFLTFCQIWNRLRLITFRKIEARGLILNIDIYYDYGIKLSWAALQVWCLDTILKGQEINRITIQLFTGHLHERSSQRRTGRISRRNQPDKPWQRWYPLQSSLIGLLSMLIEYASFLIRVQMKALGAGRIQQRRLLYWVPIGMVYSSGSEFNRRACWPNAYPFFLMKVKMKALEVGCGSSPIQLRQ